MKDSSIEGHANIALRMLTLPQIARIHQASLEILERTGVVVRDPTALALLKQGGASVDSERVRLNAHLVEGALKTAPPRISIYRRGGEPAMCLEGWNSYFGTGSDCPSAIDPDTQQHRTSTKGDVGRIAQLCDMLPNIDFCMSMGIAWDVSTVTSFVHQFDAMARHTSKPLVYTANDVEDMRDILALAEIVVDGGSRELEERPRYIHYNEPISPLHHSPNGLAKLLFCAQHKIPMIYIGSPMMGASAPVTMAGCIALANAEALSGLVIHQMKNPGAPFVFGADATLMDMRTAVYAYGAPELQIMDIAFADLAHYYHLPFFCIAGATDSKVLDAQAGAEMAVSLLVSALNGCNLIHDVGYLESGLCCSIESVVMADELVGMVKRYRSGFDITAETLALDIIDEVGPQKDYLSHPHTAEHFKKDAWYPEVLDRRRFEAWVEAGGEPIEAPLRRRAQKLLATAQPPAFTASQIGAIDRILAQRG
jgi:trimethylamine--corrinoid protein Co-methyltransferase